MKPDKKYTLLSGTIKTGLTIIDVIAPSEERAIQGAHKSFPKEAFRLHEVSDSLKLGVYTMFYVRDA